MAPRVKLCEVHLFPAIIRSRGAICRTDNTNANESDESDTNRPSLIRPTALHVAI